VIGPDRSNAQQIIVFGTGGIAELADFYFTHDSEFEVVGFFPSKNKVNGPVRILQVAPFWFFSVEPCRSTEDYVNA
jgi:hypothetical protein